MRKPTLFSIRICTCKYLFLFCIENYKKFRAFKKSKTTIFCHLFCVCLWYKLKVKCIFDILPDCGEFVNVVLLYIAFPHLFEFSKY